MSNLAVITPTKRYGGLGEQYINLSAQSLMPDVWIIADDLYSERKSTVEEMTRHADFQVVHYEPKEKPEGYYSNISGIYNEMLEICLDLSVDHIVSLQDYCLAPVNGIERFVETLSCQEGIATGLCSHTNEPPASEVFNPQGHLTIFRNIWTGGEVTYLWEDVRTVYAYAGEIVRVHAINWEMNWSAWNADLVRHGLRFDETYGLGIGHENQDFAHRARMDHGQHVFLDLQNHAISLPHRLYFPEEWEEQTAQRETNMRYHRDKWAGTDQLEVG